MVLHTFFFVCCLCVVQAGASGVMHFVVDATAVMLLDDIMFFCFGFGEACDLVILAFVRDRVRRCVVVDLCPYRVAAFFLIGILPKYNVWRQRMLRCYPRALQKGVSGAICFGHGTEKNQVVDFSGVREKCSNAS